MLEFAQGRNGLRQRDAAQQHILVDTGQGGARPRQRFGGLANGFALGVGLLAIDECSVDEDVQYGALSFRRTACNRPIDAQCEVKFHS